MNIDDLKDTLQLRRFLLKSLCDLHDKQLTPSEARARSWLARAAIDTMRLEIVAAREGLNNYRPVNMIDPAGSTIIDVAASSE